MSDAFEQMDSADADLITAMYEGTPVATFVYDIIDYAKEHPKANPAQFICDMPAGACPEKDKHKHIRSVNIACIFEIINRMKCVQCQVISDPIIKYGGQDYIKLSVEAIDALNIRQGVATVHVKVGYDLDKAYKQALKKAERNAYRELIPQSALAKLVDIARQGRKELTTADVEATFGVIFAERERMLDKHFEKLLQMNSARLLSSRQPTAILPALPPPLPAEKTIPAEYHAHSGETQSDPELDKPSEKQLNYFKSLLDKHLADKELRNKFIAEKAISKQAVGDLIKAFAADDYCELWDWNEHQEASPPPSPPPPPKKQFAMTFAAAEKELRACKTLDALVAALRRVEKLIDPAEKDKLKITKDEVKDLINERNARQPGEEG